MSGPPRGAHPRVLLAAAAEQFGDREVVAWCGRLVTGEDRSQDPDLGWLGGTEDWPSHWRRVWGARGLLYVWDDAALETVARALADKHWRVREMACKGCARPPAGPALRRRGATARGPSSQGQVGGRACPRQAQLTAAARPRRGATRSPSHCGHLQPSCTSVLRWQLQGAADAGRICQTPSHGRHPLRRSARSTWSRNRRPCSRSGPAG